MKLKVADRFIGNGQPCYVIAEAGVNHNGSMEQAQALIDVAVAAGADAVKFQTFKSERLVTESAPKADYQARNTKNSETQLEMLRRLELREVDHYLLMEYCKKKGITFLSTPFDELSADFLEKLGVLAYKLPSGELTNIPFLNHVASKRLPLIVSTGMATLGEVEVAVNTIQSAGNDNFALLHCVSNYPADPADSNLLAMKTMESAFQVPVGYSDHTLGIAVPLAAVALGACIIEKHFTLDRKLPGPDHAASAEPAELKELINGIRTVEKALGDGRKKRVASESNTATVARKSIVAAEYISTGSVITREKLAIMRPGTGLPSNMLDFVVGRRARGDISKGTLISVDLLS